MIHMKDTIEVKAPPEKVYAWLLQRMTNAESYKEWHPDHVDLKWIKGPPMAEGSIIYAEEYLHGELHKLKFRITKVVPNQKIEYQSLFPLSLLAPGNQFLIQATPEGCVFTASGSLRIPEWLFKKMHKKHEHKLEATARHMKEEGENLKKAVEGDG